MAFLRPLSPPAANAVISELGLCTTASVTMSRLVDYDALPDFLTSLGFKAVMIPPSLTMYITPR